MLTQIKCIFGFICPYDPIGKILAVRTQLKSPPYFYVPKLDIEKFVNKDNYEEKTLQEMTKEKTLKQSLGHKILVEIQ